MPNPFGQPTTEYLYTMQPVRLAIMSEGPTEQEAPVIAEHWAYLQDLARRGILIFGGRTLTTDESSFASVVFRADSGEQARSIMECDPAVRSGIMRARLYPYQVLLMEGRK